MDLVDRKVDELWDRVNAINQDLMLDWLNHFSGSYLEQKLKSKLEIKSTVTNREYQADPRRNFLCKLVSRNRSGNFLAMTFLRVMAVDSFWENFISTRDTRGFTVHGEDQTPLDLHNAARFENLERVKQILECGTLQLVDRHGFTPLHCAAMAIHPDVHIARRLINFNKGWLNKQTEDERGRNTALHIAAGNVNVTESFIRQFEEADTKLLNSMKDTAFHVAAKSYNQEVIIYMLNTFEPTNNRWDVDNVDEGQDFSNKLIICARKGNAKAVALLIKHGADISQGVLHEIVLESVRKPKKMDKLAVVYQTIVDNAITWRCLEENNWFRFKGSTYYKDLMRQTMVWLLTKPSANHSDKDVLRFALDYGASAMLWRIINTKSVFRTDGIDTCRWFDKENRNTVKNEWESETQADVGATKSQKKRYGTVFDVTCFTEDTVLKPVRDGAGNKSCFHEISESTALSSRLSNDDGDVQSRPIIQETQHAGNGAANIKVRYRRTSIKARYYNFDKPECPPKPYLTCLLMAFNHWRKSDILNTQPFKKLTEPYIKLMQRCYFIFGLLQLIFIISFTAIHMPSKCSLVRMFNVPTMRCPIYSHNVTDIALRSPVGRQRSWITLLWLIWPAILIPTKVFTLVQRIKQENLASRLHSEKLFVKAKDMSLSLLNRYCYAVMQSSMTLLFCITIVVWMFVYFLSDAYELYVDVTGMVFLSGWIANLEFFIVVNKNVNIFALVLGKIVVKDIPSFMLFFGFFFVGYTFAVHALRMSSCTPNEHLDETFFSVLSSAFGIGDFYEGTMAETKCASAAMQYLFEIIYFFYVCATMIILLNVLIAMMNMRYERAKPKAENILRFQLLSVMRTLEDHKVLVKVLKKFRLLDLPDVVDSKVPCRYGDDDQSYLYFNSKLNRYYLKLALPLDEQLQRPQ